MMKSQRIEKDTNTKHKQAGMAITMSKTVGFQERNITSNREIFYNN